MIRLHIVTWGERCNTSLVNILLPSLIQGETYRFLVNVHLEISTEEPFDVPKSRFASVKFFPIDESLKDQRYSCASKAEQAFVRRCDKDDIMVFLPPDFVAAKGSMSLCVNTLGDEYDLVVAAVPRCRNDRKAPLDATPSELIKWCWLDPHRFTERQTWGNVPSYRHGSMIYFPCQAGFVARCHHLHPIAMRKTGDINFTSSVDDDMISGFSTDRIAICDPLRAAFMELSPPEIGLATVQQKPLSFDDIMKFRERGYIRDVNRFFFRHRILFRLKKGSDDAEDLSVLGQL